jgi:hypothetical protein
MAVTSGNGILTSSGNGNLDIGGILTKGVDFPPTVDISSDTGQPWFYRYDDIDGARMFYWDTLSTVWRPFTPKLPHASFLLAQTVIGDSVDYGSIPFQMTGYSGDSIWFRDNPNFPTQLQVPLAGTYLVTTRLTFSHPYNVNFGPSGLVFRLRKLGLVNKTIAVHTYVIEPNYSGSTRSLTLTGHTYMDQGELVSVELYNWSGVAITVNGDLDISLLYADNRVGIVP